MARVTGIGGVFLRSPDPARLAQWYAANLGIKLTPWGGAKFSWKDEFPAGTGATAWSVFAAKSDYMGEPAQQFMVNYRVDDLPALLAQLEAAAVWIDPQQQDSEYGRFAWVKDCDGNRVELWQPPVASTDGME
jgi:predicted enzyme related to lactoylglutathione lyase